MNIALVSQEYPPETAHGGIATQTYIRAHGLSSLGHKVYVISHSLDNIRVKYLDKDVRVIRIPGYDTNWIPNNDSSIWLSYSVQVAQELHKLDAEVKFDLIVFPEYGGEGFVYLLNRIPFNPPATIVHIHGPLIMFANTMNWPDKDSEFYRIGTMMESTSLRLADAVSASNICSANWCIEHYGLRVPIPVKYSGIDTSVFYPRKIAKHPEPTIIFVGSIRESKGVFLLVQAACRLKSEFPLLKVQLVGRGDGSTIKSLKEIADSAGFSDLLEFTGPVNREDLPIYLTQAMFFVSPSFYEGGPGNVYLEAMACGIPAIGCSGSGIEGIVRNMENGLLIPPKDLEELIQAMRKLLGNPGLCDLLGKKAKAFVLNEADSNICLKALESYYQSVVYNVRQLTN